MVLLQNSILLSCAAILVVWVWKVFYWVWLTPKKLEKCLKQQGFKGNSYKLWWGDANEMAVMIREAKCSKPISLSDNILPRVVPHLYKAFKTHGKKSILWFGTRPSVLIMDPELVKEVMTKNFQYQKQRTNPLTKLLVAGVASFNGQKWAQHRKIMNPAFHLEKLKHMMPAFHWSCSEMISKWDKIVSTKGGSCELDVWPHLQTLTCDAISRTAFGSSYEEGRKIFELQREQTGLLMQVARQIYIPGSRFLPTTKNIKMKEIAKVVETSITDIISKKRKAIEEGDTIKDDLLGLLIESNFKEMEQQGHKKFGMSISEVIQECKLFYFAGQETTSVLLTWVMVLLSRHQNWQDRAREEVLQVFGNKMPDFDGLNHLKTVTLILYEVLRLYPPILALSRFIHEETKLGDITVPVGVELSLPIALLHHDPELWGDDVEEFKPERFAEGISKATKGQVSFFPFGWGPRICIGQNFALLEAKMAMAMILQRFSFELSPSYAHTPDAAITLQPQHGAPLILRKL